MHVLPDPPTFAEFFAGIGLVRAGLTAGGWQCVYANDLDPAKQRMHAAAFPADDTYHLADVWDTSAVLERIVGRPTLATASSPCTDLSTAGYYEGLAGSQSSAFFGFTRVLEEMRRESRLPPLLLFENVPGLLTSRGGEDFATAARTLADLGYFLDAFVIDAKHFKPQSRPRLFVMGVLREAVPTWALAGSPTPLFHGGWNDRLDDRPDVRPRRLVKAMRRISLSTGWLSLPLPALPRRLPQLDDLLDADEVADWWPLERVDLHLSMMSDRHAGEVMRLRQNDHRHVGTIYRRRRHGHMRAEARFDGLAGCLRTPKGGSARQIVIVVAGDKTQMRWMSPGEYAKLQGAGPVPPGVPATAAMFGYADGVCVPVIEWIDRHVLTPLRLHLRKSRVGPPSTTTAKQSALTLA